MAANQQQAAAKGLSLTCCSTHARVFTDPSLLERIIENFVTNAIRYTESGGVSIDVVERGSALSIEVADTGIGIEAGELDRIFEEYYQLDNPVRSHARGLGLGLSIVKHIARLLEHTLDVKSDPGEGSVFIVTVPLSQPAQPNQQPALEPRESPTKPSRKRVLLVDDDPAVLDSTALFLSSAETEVVCASDPASALAHIHAGPAPDLLVCDYRLPGMTGTALVQKVREILARDIPAILITGDTATLGGNADGLTLCTIMYKPIDPQRLEAIIQSLTAAPAP